MSNEPDAWATRIHIRPLTASDDDPADQVPGAWEHIGIRAAGNVRITWDGMEDDDMTWIGTPDWEMRASTSVVIGDGHPDTLYESADYPCCSPGFWALTPYSSVEEAFLRVVTLKDATHTVSDNLGSSLGSSVTIEVHEPRQVQYPQMCSLFQHPSPEYVREVARQLLTGERLAYTRPITVPRDDPRFGTPRTTAWHRVPVYFVKLWRWGIDDRPHSSTVLRLDRPLPPMASVAQWPLVDSATWPATGTPVVEADLEDVPWLKSVLGGTT